MLGTTFNLMNPLDRFLIKDITADTVHSISGIADNPSSSQRIKHGTDKTGLGIIGIDLNMFRHVFPETPTE